MDANVLIIGSGGAGLCAAIAAADQGAKVLLIEKDDKLGGTFHISQGTSAGTQTKMQFEAGICNDSPTVFFADCWKEVRARQVCDPEILMYYCQQSGFTVDWLYDLGAYEKAYKCTNAIYGEQWSVGRVYRVDWAKSYLEVILKEFDKRVARGDVKTLLNTTVSKLVNENGRITGVIADGKTYKAGAVIMATGGFSGNTELMRKYKFPGARAIINGGSPGCKGEGMVMCEQVGAAMVNMDQELLPYIGSIPDPTDPTRPIGHLNFHDYPSVWVDLNGKRVANEDGNYLLPPARIGMLKAPEMALFVIVDKKIITERPDLFVPWIDGSPARDTAWLEEKAKEGKFAWKADSIEELAKKAGMNAPALGATIERWNSFVASGKDEDFKRPNLKYKIENAPFYAIMHTPCNLISAGGPKTNVYQQVIDTTDKVIPGLYAAGEVTGYRAFGTGSLNTGNFVFGKQAGQQAAWESLGMPRKG